MTGVDHVLAIAAHDGNFELDPASGIRPNPLVLRNCIVVN
jgi:hypothetical protein